MKHRLLTPGPTPVSDELHVELARPVIYHRGAQFRQILAEVLEDLKYVFCTQNMIAAITASGTGAMEAAVSNTVAPGSKVICLISGRWGERWRNVCKAFGAEAVAGTAPYGNALKQGATPFTPENSRIRALRHSLKMIRAEGLENMGQRHARVAAAARAGLQALGLELFANPPADGVTVFKVPDGFDGVLLLNKLEKQYGIRLAGGQDTLKGKI